MLFLPPVSTAGAQKSKIFKNIFNGTRLPSNVIGSLNWQGANQNVAF